MGESNLNMLDNIIVLIYKVIRKIKFYAYKKYVISKLNFKTKKSKKSIKILGNNIIVNNPNVWIGEDVTLYNNVQFNGFGKIDIGNNVKIGTGVIFNSYKNFNITIGNFTIIAAYCYIINLIHNYDINEKIQNQEDAAESIYIGNDCWIATHCILAKGAGMGNGSILGANSYLDKTLNTNSVSYGSPAKEIKKR